MAAGDACMYSCEYMHVPSSMRLAACIASETQIVHNACPLPGTADNAPVRQAFVHSISRFCDV